MLYCYGRYTQAFARFVLDHCSERVGEILNEIDDSVAYGVNIDVMQLLESNHILGVYDPTLPRFVTTLRPLAPPHRVSLLPQARSFWRTQDTCCRY